ncbi:MAG: Crp/Fnr family transcriptional regulator [Candidatus Omnitrophica bacterium]|nr:Crp/Fnr family transcriptional regulator [Candidatus Omnitrophota bacterium]
MISIQVLQQLSLFQGVSAEPIKKLAASCELEPYPKGATLFRQGQSAQFMWVIQQGWVHLIRASERNGRPRGVVIFTITPQEALCGISAIDSGVYNLSAIAGTHCQAVRIPSEGFRSLLLREPIFAFRSLSLCARRLQHIALQYGAMAEPVSNRIVRAMLRLQQQFGSTLPVTHRELAQMSWTTTESAIRIVRRLKRSGYVSGMRGRLNIRQAKDLEGLLVAENQQT